MKKLLTLTLFFGGLAAAQTTTTYTPVSGTKNGNAQYTEAQAIAWNSIAGIKLTDAAGDYVLTGQPVPQFIPVTVGIQPVYCLDVVTWTVAAYPALGTTGQVWTFSCPDSSTMTAISATVYTTWEIITEVVGGKGGSRKQYIKIYTTADPAVVASNFQVTQ